MPVYIPNQADINGILAGNQAAGARLIRGLEDGAPEARQSLKELYPHSGKAFVIGITGSPGVGKSTLVDKLITEFRQMEKKVAVIAIDPSSPVSGGAILGDRLRMQRHAADDKVFIRSMASRGRQGGLSRSTKDALIVLAAMAYDIIIIETAGAGQTEVDVSKLAHSVGIVTIPGTGDGIQAIKAGILETGDVYIVNKCERREAEAAIFELGMMLDYRHYAQNDWKPVILKTEALKGTGVRELAHAFLSHYEFLKQQGLLVQIQKEMDLAYFKTLVKDLALEKIMTAIKDSGEYHEAFRKIDTGEVNPLTAAEELIGLIRLNV
jgi:LAO/AO transport system kinase